MFHSREADEYYFQEGCHVLERLNDPADPDASIARARVPPGGRTRRHRLIGTTERYLLTAGTGEVEVGDGPPTPVTAGDVVLIPPDTPQRITNTGDGDLVFLAICTPRFRPDNYREA